MPVEVCKSWLRTPPPCYCTGSHSFSATLEHWGSQLAFPVSRLSYYLSLEVSLTVYKHALISLDSYSPLVFFFSFALCNQLPMQSSFCLHSPFSLNLLLKPGLYLHHSTTKLLLLLNICLLLRFLGSSPL